MPLKKYRLINHVLLILEYFLYKSFFNYALFLLFHFKQILLFV